MAQQTRSFAQQQHRHGGALDLEAPPSLAATGRDFAPQAGSSKDNLETTFSQPCGGVEGSSAVRPATASKPPTSISRAKSASKFHTSSVSSGNRIPSSQTPRSRNLQHATYPGKSAHQGRPQLNKPQTSRKRPGTASSASSSLSSDTNSGTCSSSASTSSGSRKSSSDGSSSGENNSNNNKPTKSKTVSTGENLHQASKAAMINPATPEREPRSASGSESDTMYRDELPYTPPPKFNQAYPETDDVVDGDMVKVYLRLRPHEHRSDERSELIFTRAEDDTLQVVDEMTVDTVAPEESQSFKNRETGGKYKFTRIFDKPTTQSELFEATTLPLVETLIEEGKDGLLFAYGVTNAGKTYTVEGCEENPGIIPRTLQSVFDQLEKKVQLYGFDDPEEYLPKVEVSYLQIYNEQVHDLQAPAKAHYLAKERLKIKLRDEGVEVEGLKSTPIYSCAEGLDILIRGREARETHETECNLQSSRSHSVFVVTVEQKGRAARSSKPARLYIVDLAGSERGKRTNSSRARQREASNINCSLMNLMRCLDTLRLNQKQKRLNKREKMVPFRESKLTLLFRDCFVGSNCGGVAMIVNASARPEDYDETAHALKYGALVKNVKVARKAFTRRKSGGAQYDIDGRRIRGNQRGANAMMTPSNHNNNGTPGHRRTGSRKEQRQAIPYPDEYYDTDDDMAMNVSLEEHPVVHALIHELADARLKCVTMETEIREEVAQEMAQRLEEMEAVFRSRVDAAKQISDNKSEMLLKNLRNRMMEGGKSNVYSLGDIEALVQNINECEEEMERMRKLHSAELQLQSREIEQLKELLLAKDSPNADIDNSKPAAEAAAVAGARRKSLESHRKSFERLDRIVVDQLDAIKRYKEELTEERALHEKTIKQLESATQLAKDAQVGEADAERQIDTLRTELEQLREQLQAAKQVAPAYDGHTTPTSAASKSNRFKHIPSPLLPLRARRQKTGSSDENSVSSPASTTSTPYKTTASSGLRPAGPVLSFDDTWTSAKSSSNPPKERRRSSAEETNLAREKKSARSLNTREETREQENQRSTNQARADRPYHHHTNFKDWESPSHANNAHAHGNSSKSFASLLANSKHKVEGAADGSRGLVSRMVGRMRRDKY